MNIERNIYGCEIQQLSSDDSKKVLDNITNKSLSTESDVWLLAWQNDGVIWGISRKGVAAIELSSEEFPEYSPQFNPKKLLELRLFQHDQEILLWQQDGVLAGRIVTDSEVDTENVMAPFSNSFLLLGDKPKLKPNEKKKSFSLIESKTGAINFPPVDATNLKRSGGAGKLHMKNYFEQDPESGMLRVALTRLVSVEQSEVQ